MHVCYDMPNFTIRIDEDLKQRMGAHEEINWSHVMRESVRSKLDDLERMDELAVRSDLTEDDVEELAESITAAAAERAREDLEELDSEAIETALENRRQARENAGGTAEHVDTGH